MVEATHARVCLGLHSCVLIDEWPKHRWLVLVRLKADLAEVVSYAAVS